MVHKFIFSIPPDHEFKCDLRSFRCTGQTKSGSRCRKRVVFGVDLCWMHLLSTKHLRILPSLIPNAGKGLFALDRSKDPNAIIFRKGDIIGTYIGDGPLTEAQIDARYTDDVTGPYTFELGRSKTFIDSACKRGYGSLINQGNSPSMNNVQFYDGFNTVNGQRRPVIKFRAIKNIRNNQELYGSYGEIYQFEDNYRTT